MPVLLMFWYYCIQSIFFAPSYFRSFTYFSGNFCTKNLGFWPYLLDRFEQFVSATPNKLPHIISSNFADIQNTICRCAFCQKIPRYQNIAIMDRDLEVKFYMIVIIQDGLIPTLRRNLSRRRGRRAAALLARHQIREWYKRVRISLYKIKNVAITVHQQRQSHQNFVVVVISSCRLFFKEFQNSPMEQSSEENPSSRSDTGEPPNQHVVVNTHIKLNIYL